jgi:hypothetical protein
MKITAVSVTPIKVNKDEAVPADGASLQAVGFGTTETGSHSIPLMEAEVLRVPDSQCYFDPSIVLCALNTEPFRTVCSGDSGGPLIDIGTKSLVGIVAFGPGCDKSRPSGYTRVSAYFDWLQQEVCELSANPPLQFQCPSKAPTTTPSLSPTTLEPTSSPTVFPTGQPTASPSISPSLTPSTTPSNTLNKNSVEIQVTCVKITDACENSEECCRMQMCNNGKCGKCWKRNHKCTSASQCCSGKCRRTKRRMRNGKRGMIRRCM